jgi:hypothetical protein
MNNTKKSFLNVLALVVVVVVVFVGWRFYDLNRSPKNTFSSENVQLKKQASFFSGKSKLPEGFPKEIPIEAESLVQSDVLVYPDRNATLYSVSYTSSKTIEELTEIYKSYYYGTPYILHLDNFGKKIGDAYVFVATSASKDLTVMLTPQAGAPTVVQLSYLVRN